VNAFRGYASGLTLIGAADALVVGLGAWLLGVPLVGTIAVVTFVTSYVPYLGAFVAGAFAVVIAYGSGGRHGPGDAGDRPPRQQHHPKPARTIRVRHAPSSAPLAVLITVTSATRLFGVLGAILAAPLASAAVNTCKQVQDAGLLDDTIMSPDGSGSD
jgi:predicted PurR-regulated permease PerM